MDFGSISLTTRTQCHLLAVHLLVSVCQALFLDSSFLQAFPAAAAAGRNVRVVGLVVRISAFQADGPGSIPGQRIVFGCDPGEEFGKQLSPNRSKLACPR